MLKVAVFNAYAKLQFLDTRMWADAQRDGHPVEYRCHVPSAQRPQSFADAHHSSAVQ